MTNEREMNVMGTEHADEPRQEQDAPPTLDETMNAIDEAEAEAEAVHDQEAVEATSPEPSAQGLTPTIIEQGVVDMLHTIYDPEIPVDIYELGLIYEVNVDDEGMTEIRMTLTSPACPVAGSLPGEVEDKARMVAGVTDARVELVWDPPWNPDMMSEDAKLELGFF